MTQHPRVGFTGYYGMRNFGDDLFGVLCSTAARQYWNAEPLLVGPALDGARARAMPRSVHKRCFLCYFLAHTCKPGPEVV